MMTSNKQLTLILALGFVLTACTTTTTVDGKPVTDKPKKVEVTQANKLADLPEYAQLNYSLGVSYIQSGHIDTAAQKLAEVIRIAPKFPDVYNAMGVLEEERGRKDQAQEYFLKALSLKDGYEEASANYSRLQCKTGQSIDPVMSKVKASVRVGLYAGAAQCALDSSNTASAESYVQQAIALDPNYAATYLVKAKLDAKNNNPSGAFTNLDRYHNLQGYTASSIQFGMDLATQAGDSVRMEKYKHVQSTQFKK